MKNIRTAIIGAGYRGRYLITLLQKINLFDIIAVSDISPNLSEIISQLFAGEKIPKIYNSGTDDYRRMLNENTIDLVIIASPWHLHKEQTIEALKSGCHVAIEVKGALDINEYPDIIHESRQNKKQVFPLENTLFRNDILAINNMIHAGIFGRLVFLQGGYRHDLTHILIDQTGNFGVQNGSESEWRSKYYETENGAQINLLHDTTLPRPRSLNYEVQGTNGIWNAEKNAIYIDGLSPFEEWEPEDKYIEQYKHRFWQQWESEALRYDGHHQGMDYIMLRVLGEALQGRENYPATLEDMATWAAVSPYSKISIQKGTSIPFPHF